MRNLSKGTYMLGTEGSFPLTQNSEGSVTVSLYSRFKGVIEPIKKPDPLLLHKVFLNHAIYSNEDKR